MGFSFRKSKTVGGVRLTAGKKSASASVGRKGARVTANTKGRVNFTLGIPGTGLRWTYGVGGRKGRRKAPRKRRGATAGNGGGVVAGMMAAALGIGCLLIVGFVLAVVGLAIVRMVFFADEAEPSAAAARQRPAAAALSFAARSPDDHAAAKR